MLRIVTINHRLFTHVGAIDLSKFDLFKVYDVINANIYTCSCVNDNRLRQIIANASVSPILKKAPEPIWTFLSRDLYSGN